MKSLKERIREIFNPKYRKRLISIVVALLIILVLVGVYLQSTNEPPIEVVFDTVKTRTVTQLVSGSGKINPETEVKLSPEVSGEIIELPIEEGDTVSRGDLLFRINPREIKEQVRQSQAQLMNIRAQTLQARAGFLKAEDFLRRQKKLYDQSLLAEYDYQSSQTSYEVEKAKYEASQHLEKMQESVVLQTRERFYRTSVRSPIDGVVTLLNSKLGERVVGTMQMQGTEVVRVADLSQMEAIMEVNENDIVKVSVGDTSLIYVDAYEGRIFKGIVREIASVATTISSGSQEEVTNFIVKIRILKSQELLLKTGMSAFIDIQSETVENVRTVPIQCVTIRYDSFLGSSEINQDETLEDQNKKEDNEKMLQVVYVKEGSIVRQRLVKTGISDERYIHIKSGVEEDESVVSGSYKAITKELYDGAEIIEKKRKKRQPAEPH